MPLGHLSPESMRRRLRLRMSSASSAAESIVDGVVSEVRILIVGCTHCVPRGLLSKVANSRGLKLM